MTEQDMALRAAIDLALREMGIAAFKRTSFFLRNNSIPMMEKIAA